MPNSKNHKKFKSNLDLDCEKLISISRGQVKQDLFVVCMTQGKKNGRWLEIGAGQPVDGSNTWLLEHYFSWYGDSIELRDPDLSTEDNAWRGFYSDVRSYFQQDPSPDWISLPSSIYDLTEKIQQEFRTLHHYDNVSANWSKSIKVPKSRLEWQQSRPNTNIQFTDALDFDYSTLKGTYDYLQIDIDQPFGSLRCLKKILKHHEFSAVTFEHDVYKHTVENDFCRSNSRDIMTEHGYILIAGDIICGPDLGKSVNGEDMKFEDWYVHPNRVDPDIVSAHQIINHDNKPIYWYDVLLG
jgi:hypothetical protein